MFRDFAVNYKDNAVHAHDFSCKYRAVIDHQRDIVVMSGNKCVLTLYKANNYSDLMIKSLYIAVKYMRNGTMYMCKMGTLPFFVVNFYRGLFLGTFTVLLLCNLFY